MSGKLFIVGTPIGNLKDITIRALEILKFVDVIFCEDTRHSSVLLNFYDIKKPSYSLHKFNEKKETQKVLEFLQNGQNVAYISDAGMPSVSDPGYILVCDTKESGFDVEIIPGVTAVTTAIVGSGLNTQNFCFLGFLPEKQKDKQTLLDKYRNLDATLCFYSSSHNLNKDLQDLYKYLGDREVVVAKELTKKFEEYIKGNLKDLKFDNPKGEFVVLVSGVVPTSPLNDLTIEDHFEFYVSQGQTKMEAIKNVAKDRKLKKDEVYKHFVK